MKGKKRHLYGRFSLSLVLVFISCSLVSMCVSSSPLFLRSSLFSFHFFLVFDVFLLPSYFLFALLLSALESITPASVHLYLLDLHRPRWPVKGQDIPCAARYGSASPRTAPARPESPQGYHQGTPVSPTSMGSCCSIPSPI